jgi:hypothetical protein
VRTAVIIAAVAVTAKVGLTAVALTAWVSIPERHWPPNHLHIELGSLAEWLAAFAAAGAAIVALVIATRDRQERAKEHEDDQKAQARLVRLAVKTQLSGHPSGMPVLSVKVRNNGHLPILDVEVTDATWTEHPNARWDTVGETHAHRKQSILRPWQTWQREQNEEIIEYALVPKVEKQVPGSSVTQYVPIDLSNIDLSKVAVMIQFKTANGVRWETPTQGQGTGEPVRL